MKSTHRTLFSSALVAALSLCISSATVAQVETALSPSAGISSQVQPPLSPCSQSWSATDLEPVTITYYVYADGALTDTVTFDDIEQPALAWQHLQVDSEGAPLTSVLRQPPNAEPDRPPNDCTTNWCSRAWIGECVGVECARDELERVTVMWLAGGREVSNDYSCWAVQDDSWTYVGPSVDDLLMADDGRWVERYAR